MSIVITSAVPGSPVVANGSVKVVATTPPSPTTTPTGHYRRTFAPFQLKNYPEGTIALDYSDQMRLAVRVAAPSGHTSAASTPPPTPIRRSLTSSGSPTSAAMALKRQNVVMSAPTSPAKSTFIQTSPISSAVSKGQSLLTRRAAPAVFTLANPRANRSPTKASNTTTTTPVKRQQQVTALPTTPSPTVAATTTTTPDPGSSPSKLRELLMAQLELIQKQSEAIVSKDRQLQQLKRENRQLVQRLQEFNEDVRVEVISPKKRVRNADKGVGTGDDLTGGGPSKKKRKKKAEESEDDLDEEDVEGEGEDEEEEQPVLETLQTYFTCQGEEWCRDESRRIRSILSDVREVPRWRERTIEPLSVAAPVSLPSRRSGGGSSSAAPTNAPPTEEDVNEATVLKRHEKPEALEKRRKRWDLQILRQQRQVERLRAVHEGGDSPVPVPGSSTGSDLHAGSAPGADVPVRTFFPDPDRATHIQVGDSLPVSAFGFPLPVIGTEEDNASILGHVPFRLPFEVGPPPPPPTAVPSSSPPAAPTGATPSGGITSGKTTRRSMTAASGSTTSLRDRKSLLKQ